ncbi:MULTISPECIES: diguanylate cyclase [unclassified Pseudomonas]|uniref:GGDEF domain-containing protein n=1 Tax=unclassified Pseudomonas TaxID=196821 RepID=UPI00240A2C8D|nr:GGDEF domain-containing protein [Pseudomonas sp. NyZ480]WEZ86511.1 GGDEF domain-containing protein [Pseudomonas sp. NyZ480]
MDSAIDFNAVIALTLDYLKLHFTHAEWSIVRVGADEAPKASGSHFEHPTLDAELQAITNKIRADLLVNDVHAPGGVIQHALSGEHGDTTQTTQYVAIPLLHYPPMLYGFIYGRSVDRNLLENRADLRLLELIASLLSSLLHAETQADFQARRAERFETQAYTDAMTNLFNRAAWEQLLHQEELRCERQETPCAVIVIDLDDLKQTNDAEGHYAGDQLIKRAATSLLQASRKEDIVARLGGDEFGIIATHCNEYDGACLLQRIRDLFKKEKINASIGMAPRQPSGSLKKAFIRADQAMYKEKRVKRGSATARTLENPFTPGHQTV